ncbi:MAG: hypothetical protein FWH01_15990 [Oscillospiraceae bacterium]|nr:hypothetical protein [Oscillospiraceae bacterium]
MWSWGYNAVGQLGDGTQLLRAAPVRIFRDGIAKVYAGNQHALALTEGGVLWAWGFNDSGQLGDGTRVNSPSPVRVMDGVVAASAGNQPVTSDPYNFSLALKSDGSLWHWGRNSPRFRQRGVDSSVPEEVAGGVAEIGLVAGLAVMADGSLWNLGWEGTYGPPRKVMDGVRMASGASPAKPPAPGRAAPTRSEVLVNGARVDFDAYLIGGNNYFKLRDVAYALNGTAKQFSVGYDGATRAVALATGAPYSPVGGELAPGDGSAKAYSPTRSVVYVDGAEASMEVYVIGGNNYFKLRDLGAAVGFSVGYDNATRVITITT